MNEKIISLFSKMANEEAAAQTNYVAEFQAILDSAPKDELELAEPIEARFLLEKQLTPLQIACYFGRYDLATFLLNTFNPNDLGINDNNNAEGNTALHLLEKRNQSISAKESKALNLLRALLLVKGADPEIRNHKGETASDIHEAHDEGFDIVEEDDKALYRRKLTEWEGKPNLSPHEKDKQEIAENLLNFMKPFGSRTDQRVQGGVYGWEFETLAPPFNPNEINMVFLGTGSMPYFGEHDVISEGGDVLCQIAYQKAMAHHQPVMFMKGVGTAKLNELEFSPNDIYYPLESLINPNSKYAGGKAGLALGSGTDRRLKIAMEEFFIPQLVKMIANSQKIKQGDNDTFEVNIVGHSRGGITSYYMVSLIDEWIKYIQSGGTVSVEKMASMCNVDQQTIQAVLQALRSSKAGVNLALLGFDPVEGGLKVGGTYWLNRKNSKQNLKLVEN